MKNKLPYATQFDIAKLVIERTNELFDKYDFEVIDNHQHKDFVKKGRMTNCVSGCSGNLVKDYITNKEEVLSKIAEEDTRYNYAILTAQLSHHGTHVVGR